MKILTILIMMFTIMPSFCQNSTVSLDTTYGEIQIELFEKEAPISVKNFLQYVEAGFYNGTILHRVIDNFMIQGGGFDKEMNQKEGKNPIKNEATNGLTNSEGTVAMARTSEVDSATAQFFINVNENTFLNHIDGTPKGFGYAVFGKVIKGMSVVNQIRKVKTNNKGPHSNVPEQIIEIKSAKKL